MRQNSTLLKLRSIAVAALSISLGQSGLAQASIKEAEKMASYVSYRYGEIRGSALKSPRMLSMRPKDMAPAAAGYTKYLATTPNAGRAMHPFAFFDASAAKPVSTFQKVGETVAGAGLGFGITYLASPFYDADIGVKTHLGRKLRPLNTAYGATFALAAALVHGLWLRDKAEDEGVALLGSGAGALAFPLTKLASMKFKVFGGPSTGPLVISAVLGGFAGAGAVELFRRILGQ